MNSSTDKLLRKYSQLVPYTLASIKKGWYRTPHHTRGPLRKSMKDLVCQAHHKTKV